jgi:hypothetical protein
MDSSRESVKHEYRLFLITILVLLLIISIPIIIFVTYKTDDSCSEKFQSMFVNIESFPSGWHKGEPIQMEGRGKGLIEVCSVEYLVTNGVAHEEIYEYASADDAEENYQYRLDVEFRTREGLDTDWIDQNSLLLEKLNSSEEYLACAEIGSIPMCRFIGRYDEYIVVFNTHMRNSFITLRDLENVIDGIDLKFVQ